VKQLSYQQTKYACYVGYITQAVVNNLAPLLFVIFQRDFHISFEEIGRLILLNFGVQILADIFSVKYVDKLGYRKSAVLAHIFCIAGLVSLGILPKILPFPYIGLMLSVLVYAVGGGLLEVIISPIVEFLPGKEKEAAMSMLHSFYCWGQMAVIVITTIALEIFGSDFWFVLPILWAAVPLYNLFRFLKVPLVEPVIEENRKPLRKMFQTKFFVTALVLMVCSGASELAMSQWASLFAETGLGVSKVIGDLLGPCLFAVLMGIGRTVYGIYGNRIPLKKAMLILSVLCVGCYFITSISLLPAVALAGCALCGLSVSLMWPGTYSLAAKKFRKEGTAMFGVLAIFGDIGCSIGPWLTGIISDGVQKTNAGMEIAEKYHLSMEQVGLKAGLLIASVFPLIMLACLAFAKEKEKSQVSS
jgi:fucose permease